MESGPVLVTGATGYVGGRLVPQLLEVGYRVRALARSPAKLRCRPWGQHPLLEVAQGDALDLDSLRNACAGCWAAFYLVHSMNQSHRDFLEADQKAARNMTLSASEAGLNRIIYLGGLGETDDPSLSKHLHSRHQVGQILQSGSVPVTVLRAAMILGSGSASFEILRYLTDRLPVMITPSWVRTLVQPIAIRNVLNYLQGCLEHDEVLNQTFDIGGPDVLTYERLIHIYAEEARLPKRRLLRLSFLTPKLSAYWIHLVTPVPASIAKPLAEGLAAKVVCKDERIRSIIPQELLGCRETIRMALDKVRQQQVETCWSDAGALVPPEWTTCGDAHYAGGTILECGYRIRLKASAEEMWKPIMEIGGKTGWYFGNALWSVRGWMDTVAGGAGLRRGRRHPTQLYTGDALDFWRVLDVEPCERLLLLAEMKLPGEAVLEFKILPLRNDQVELRQLSRFLPKGLLGILYWYSLYPFHQWIFRGMLRNIARATGKTVVSGPQRFTPKIQHACPVPNVRSD